MILLPPKATALAKAASKDRTRYALNAVHVKIGDAEGEARLTVTDGRALVRMSVERDDVAAADLGGIDGVSSVPGEYGQEALVPAKAFGALSKRLPIGKAGRFASIALDTDSLNGVVRFGATDGESSGHVAVKTVEGPFPDADEMIPASDDGRMTVVVDPKLLRETLAVLEALDMGDGDRVTVSFARSISDYGDTEIDGGAPIVIRNPSRDGVHSLALVMPREQPKKRAEED